MSGATDAGRERPAGRSLVRTLGAGHLALAGAIDATTGAVVAYLALTDRLVVPVLTVLSGTVLPYEALRMGNRTVVLVSTGALVAGIVLCLVGVCQVVLSRAALEGRRWRASAAAAVGGVVNPIALPVAAIAVTFLLSAREEFAPQSHERSPRTDTPETTPEPDP